jgi:transcription-repair coupling factor (superfamily II helicase)
LLGEDQSGNMLAIGFHLFMDMLDKAVHDLKSGKIPELNAPMHQGPEIDLRLSAIIPESYIGDTHTRLIFYKRIAHAKDEAQLRALEIEMIDRFGLTPKPLKHLFLITALKFLAAELGISRITAQAPHGKIEFGEDARINPEKLISLIQVHRTRYQLEGPTRLRFQLESVVHEAQILEVTQLLLQLK